MSLFKANFVSNTDKSDEYMSKTNPVGTGSFSMNRKEGSVVGPHSSTFGFNNTANGNCSTAEGSMTTAEGLASHAEGMNSKAIGSNSHAEGNMTTASGNYSHTEGMNTTASVDGSHAEGSMTKANGRYSHAEGMNATTGGDASHAEGTNTKANGNYSHAEGMGTTADGESSHAEGMTTTAKGKYSHAEGMMTTASSDCSHVQGKNNIEDTENKYAHIVGNGESSSNRSNAHTLDWDGNAWFAGDVKATDSEGNEISLVDLAANAGGGDEYITKVDPVGSGTFSINRASGGTVGKASFVAGGNNNYAGGQYSHAEGSSNMSDGFAAHSEGINTRAKGSCSHSEGSNAVAEGYASHAEGMYTNAKGSQAHAEGTYTKASSNNQHVQGTCNIEDTANKYAHIVGNGESDTARSNAHTLDWDGNAWFAGDVTATDAEGNSVSLLSLANNANADTLLSTDVVNNLTSTATDLPLSAYQGKVLNDKIDNMGSSNWTLILDNDTSTKVNLTPYTEMRICVYNSGTDKRYLMCQDYFIDDIMNQGDGKYYVEFSSYSKYNDDFSHAFVDFYPTTSRSSFGVGYVDARFEGSFDSDATFKIYVK